MSSFRRILIATDAWHPQVNGVVRTLENTIAELRRLGHQVLVVEPGPFFKVPVPFYPEVAVCYPPRYQLERIVHRFAPTNIHICTEGTIGFGVRWLCLNKHWRFTTSFHTKFHEYLYRMIGLPAALSASYMRWFHARAAAVMVAVPSMERELRRHRFRNRLVRWSRGVDLRRFYPRPKTYPAADRPILMYVGRVSTEKNIEAFLDTPTPGTKYVVGDGPMRAVLQARYPQVRFLGYLHGDALAEAYANADCFVFPSKTDTFGLVIVEALACGVPVAAYPVIGPADIITHPSIGAVDSDLAVAVQRALKFGDSEACVKAAQEYTWENCTRQFLSNLIEV